MTSSSADHTSLLLNERLLTAIGDLYHPRVTTPLLTSAARKAKESPVAPLGLRAISRDVGVDVSQFHHKSNVMVMGNISAGKSTFINWYVQEAVQKTGMAIETSGFTFVTNGKIMNELGGESTLTVVPFMQEIAAEYNGLLENLSTKTCPSSSGRLRLVNLIDTPGLADGELEYPFPVEDVTVGVADHVDLILVFFDPVGQALGTRMLSVVKRLSEKCPEKLRYCATKVDEIRTEDERIKVLCQTTQSLTTKIHSRHGFDLIPIFVPGAKTGCYLLDELDGEDGTPMTSEEAEAPPPVVNRIMEVVVDIQRVVERKVQESLNSLAVDCGNVEARLFSILEGDMAVRKQNASLSCHKTLFNVVGTFLALTLAVVGLLFFVHRGGPGVFAAEDVWQRPMTHDSDVNPGLRWILVLMKFFTDDPKYFEFFVTGATEAANVPHLFSILSSALMCAVMLCFAIALRQAPKPCLSKAQFCAAREQLTFVQAVGKKQSELNEMYLSHMLGEDRA